MSGRASYVIVLAALFVAACGGAAGTTVTTSATDGAAAHGAGPRPIAAVWRSRCAQCHTPVEPKTRERGYLTAALARHRTRTRLTDAEWQGIVDYLAP